MIDYGGQRSRLGRVTHYVRRMPRRGNFPQGRNQANNQNGGFRFANSVIRDLNRKFRTGKLIFDNIERRYRRSRPRGPRRPRKQRPLPRGVPFRGRFRRKQPGPRRRKNAQPAAFIGPQLPRYNLRSRR